MPETSPLDLDKSKSPACVECGTPAEDDAAFCDRCGAALGEPAARKPSRIELVLIGVFIGVVIGVIGCLFLYDVLRGKHVLSTRDGRFRQAVQNNQPDR